MDDSNHIKTPTYSYHFDIIGKSRIPSQETNPEYIKYRTLWETNPKNKIVSEFPLHLQIESTAGCNLMCSHCFRYSRRDGSGSMEMDLYKKIIDEGKKYGLYSVNPSWMGEPFLHPQIIDMIQYAKSNGILDVRINTNGTLLDQETAEKVLDSGLDTIIFSVDTVTEDTYNRIKFGSDFKLVNENIEYLIKLKEQKNLRKPIVVVQMIDQKQTHEELLSFIYYWKPKADRIRIATYQSPDGRPDDSNRAQNTPETLFPCHQLWQRLTVAWDGSIYPCIGDNACREPLGNIKEETIHEIWHGDRLNFLREKHSNFKADDIDACLHCDLNKIPLVVDNYGKEQKSGGNEK